MAWVDALRILGATLIFWYHFGDDYQRIVGHVPATSSGLVLAVAQVGPRLALWGVSLFVVLSGLSMTLAYRGAASRRPQYGRSALRLLAPLWVIAVPYLLAGLALGEMGTSDLWKAPVWLLGLGIISPATYHPVSDAWWYVTLALQCALILPLVLRLLRRLGLTTGIALLAVTELASLWLIGLLPPEWHYLTQGLILARLIEISVGVLAAEACLRHIGWAQALFLGSMLVAAAAVGYALGARTDARIVAVWAVAVVALALLAGSSGRSPAWLAIAGVATYPFYLVHAPIGKYTITGMSSLGVHAYPVLMAIAASLSIAATVATTLVLKAATSVARRVTSPDEVPNPPTGV